MVSKRGSSVRRSHTKSRSGCLTCKGRRVRCDELVPRCGNCTRHGCQCYYRPSLNFQNPLQASDHLENWRGPAPVVINRQEDSSWRFTSAFLNFDNELYATNSNTDAHLIHHLRQVTNELQESNTHKLSFGTTELPLIMRLAVSHDYVREATLGLSATHFALATKSAEMNQLGYLHRGKAFRSLQKAIQNISRENVDGILVASIVLSWQAPEAETYMRLMAGVTSVLKAMQAWNHVSELRAYFEDFDNPSSDHSFAGDISSTSQEKAPGMALDTSICTSLDRLRPIVAPHSELSLAVRELYNFIQNQRIAPPGLTSLSQFKALHPLRTWLLWIPNKFLRLSLKDPLVLIVIAHYEAVAIAVAPLFPAASASHFVDRRVNVIWRIDEVLKSFTSEKKCSTSHDFMAVPRKCARLAESRAKMTSGSLETFAGLPFTTSDAME